MRETKIERKNAVLLAEAVFWRLLLGVYRVRPKPQWHLVYEGRLSKLGHTEVRALRPKRVGEIILSDDFEPGKCRLLTRCVQLRFHSVVIMEVLLLGKELIRDSEPKRPQLSWKIGAVRYRPVVTLRERGSLTFSELEQLRSDQDGRYISYHVTNFGHVITLFGGWSELNSSYYVGLQPSDYWPYDQIPYPEPNWP